MFGNQIINFDTPRLVRGVEWYKFDTDLLKFAQEVND